MVELILSRSGFQVISLESAVDAWSMIARGEAPRLMLVDWMMPRMDGLELCRRIRERNDRFYTYVIIMTARTLKVDLLTALQAGIDDYMTKPFNNDELVSKARIGSRLIDREDRMAGICQELQTVTDTLPVGVACLSSNGTLRRANRTLLDLWGGDPARFYGRSLGATVLRSSREYVELMNNVRAGLPFSNMPVEFTRCNGVVRRLTLSGRPMPSINGLDYQVTTEPIALEETENKDQ
jgi:CheY-like chemotaxis protein